MLEDCLFASRPSARSKKPFTLVLSVVTHVAIAGALIVIPLFQEQLLPQVPNFAPLHPPTVVVRTVELVPTSRPQSASSAPMPEPRALVAPEVIPTRIVRSVDAPVSPDVGFFPSIGIGNEDGPGLRIGIGLDAGPATPLPAPPRPPPAPPQPPVVDVPTGPVARAPEIMQSSLLYGPKPPYPRLARTARVEGRVLVEAVITREGTIDPARLRVIEGNPLLVPDTVEAVKQWRYRPTLLNGKPVEVLTTITVNFTLN
jgi:periplasmic protein TonB